MSRLAKSELRVFKDEKDLNAFLREGNVGEIIGLYLKKNESFVLFFLPYEPQKIIPKKGLKHD